mmetsp:Transcript_96291/g.229312  ORF Transcript_96291/g.229312 Transcript_96291/m.229312 type:complete len:224 (-) Transcript_96291:67-738(-)
MMLPRVAGLRWLRVVAAKLDAFHHSTKAVPCRRLAHSTTSTPPEDWCGPRRCVACGALSPHWKKSRRMDEILKVAVAKTAADGSATPAMPAQRRSRVNYFLLPGGNSAVWRGSSCLAAAGWSLACRCKHLQWTSRCGFRPCLLHAGSGWRKLEKALKSMFRDVQPWVLARHVLSVAGRRLLEMWWKHFAPLGTRIDFRHPSRTRLRFVSFDARTRKWPHRVTS